MIRTVTDDDDGPALFYDVLTDDQGLRMHVLEMALETYGTVNCPHDVVAAASAFLDFLNGVGEQA